MLIKWKAGITWCRMLSNKIKQRKEMNVQKKNLKCQGGGMDTL